MIFTQDRFEPWQARQNRKNFLRPLVVSLIQFRRREQWLFAGVYRILRTREHGLNEN